MRLFRKLFFAAVPLLALALPQPVRAAIYVGGDSLGVGVGMAGKARYVAKNSVAIRSKVVLGQIASVPRGSTLFLSLGTNDAVGNVVKVDAAVEAILKAATARDIRIVWLGPPCVFKSWDKSAAALDQRLRSLLGAHNVTYVSMRDASLCTRSVRAKDGVHFNMAGYRTMWSLAIAAARSGESAVPAVPTAAVPPVAPAAPVAEIAPVDLPAVVVATPVRGALRNVPMPRLRPPRTVGEVISVADVTGSVPDLLAYPPRAAAAIPAAPMPILASADQKSLARRFADAFVGE